MLVIAPTGAAGGGMGRVKDYMLDAPADTWPGLRLKAVVTRDHRGPFWSLLLTLAAMARILGARLGGELALVHVHFGDNLSAVRKGVITLFSRAIGVPVFLHLHAVQLERDYGAAPGWKQWLIRRPFRAATRVIVLGDRWRQWLARDLGVSSSRVDVVWNGVAVDTVQAAALADGARPHDILFLGTLGSRKGTSDLLHAFARLPTALHDWRLRLVGNGDLAHYRALAETLGVAARCTFTGWVDAAAAKAELARAAMLVLPSFEEGLPLVILEALGLGTPVICTPVGSIPEALPEAGTVLLCPPGDPEALAAAIALLASDPGLRAQMAAAGLATFQARFSVDAFRAALLAIWRKDAAVPGAAPVGRVPEAA